MKRGLVPAIATFLLAIFATWFARAQGKPEIRASLEPETVGVGETFTVTLEAQSAGAMPSDPQLGSVPSGLRIVAGPSVSSSTSIQIMNGVTVAKRGVTTTWELQAQRIGKMTVGPPSVAVGATRFGVAGLHVTVVDAAHAPPRRPKRQQNPFDPFGGLFDFGREPEPPALPRFEPETDPKLALDAPRDRGAFLHAVIDKGNAVVGEQVTFTVLLYVDTSLREPEFNDVHESPAADFLKRSLREDDSRVDTVGTANVGGRIYAVKLVRKSALFPLRTGDLEIGPMTLGIAGDASGQRQTESLHVHVTEPPVQGRPPGYVLGDVGSFELSGDVTPRTVERDGAIGVNVTLSGTGNLPAQITPPQRAGVEWLEPETHEKLGAMAGDVLGGRRTFAYVVRLHKEGDVDLGDLALPFWDPKLRTYQVAKLPLGSVHVNPGSAPATSADTPPDPLPGLPALRPTRRATRLARPHLSDSPWLWLSLAAPALAFAAAFATSTAVRRIREHRREGATSPRAELKARIAAADEAAAGADGHALDAATARALEAATIACTQVNVRGVGASDVAARLEAHGVAPGPAREVQEILRACEAARFGAASDTAEAKLRWTRARAAIEGLAR